MLKVLPPGEVVTTHKARGLAGVALAVLLIAGCASAPPVPPAARAELASTGKLRVGLILSNEVLVARDAVTGELRGVTVSLGKALAQRLGVPFEPVGYVNPAALVKSFGANEWDIAFLAFDPARAEQVVFSPPYMEVDNTYLVAAASKVASVELADQPGITIAVPERSAPDLFLSRNLKSAKVLRLPGGPDAAVDALKSGKADAYAENAHNLSLYAERLPGSRVLEGRYTVIQHAIATPPGKVAASAYVKAFVEDAKADGTVAEAIRAAGLHRTRVAQAEDKPLNLAAPNVVQISARMATSGQPNAASLASLGAQGFGGVVYLAPLTVPDAVRNEPAILEQQGIAFVNIPINFNRPTEADFQAFVAAVQGMGSKKILVHCQVNMRASSMVFLYRTVVGKESAETAYEAVTKVWSPDGPWKQFIVAQLRKNGIAFDPY